jgi:caffeoyl-CoA O-methyltransferase
LFLFCITITQGQGKIRRPVPASKRILLTRRKMINITDPRIESYLLKMAPENDPVLVAMEETAKETGVPIVDRLVGRLLYLLTCLKKPKLVVELGSGFGYSAYWFARALGSGGRVVLTDYSSRHIHHAEHVFDNAGLSSRAEFHTGDALQIGPRYNDIDILFIDIDKYLYPEAIRVMLPHLAENALVIADNALWHGTVAEKQEPGAKDSGAVREFNEYMFGNGDFFTTIIPLCDGVLLASKIN